MTAAAARAREIVSEHDDVLSDYPSIRFALIDAIARALADAANEEAAKHADCCVDRERLADAEQRAQRAEAERNEAREDVEELHRALAVEVEAVAAARRMLERVREVLDWTHDDEGAPLCGFYCELRREMEAALATPPTEGGSS